MTAFDRVLEKHNWARKHIDKFDSAFRDFRLATPHTIGREDNIETGQVRYYVQQVPAIPDELAFMLGDTLHNLRSTLDHLAYALVTAAGGKPDRQTSFPISDSANKYPSLVVAKVRGLSQPCYDILHSIQPWKGGLGHQLWQLHELDIVDKHRVLITVSLAPVGRSMTPSERAAFRCRKTPIGPRAFEMGQRAFAAANPLVVPMKAGHELGILAVNDVDETMGFNFDLAIHEANILEGVTTFLFLRGLSDEVLKIIQALEPYLG